MRIGVSLPEPSGPGTFDRLHEGLEQAASDGFASAWMSHVFGLDALTALAVAGSQVPGIELGTAVVPTYPRHPAALAQQALTADAALGGRLVLGIGLSHQVVIEDMFGYSFGQPVRHMKEYLAVLTPLLAGRPVAFAGQTVRASIGLSIPAPRRVPVLLAALAPRMLRLAGEQADGTVLWLTGPATVRDHIVPTITAAAQAAGRPSPRIVCHLPLCVTDDVARARARAAETFGIYGDLPSYRAVLDREGAAGPADVALIGNEKSVGAAITALADAGATDFVADEYTHATPGDPAASADAARTREFLISLLS